MSDTPPKEPLPWPPDQPTRPTPSVHVEILPLTALEVTPWRRDLSARDFVSALYARGSAAEAVSEELTPECLLAVVGWIVRAAWPSFDATLDAIEYAVQAARDLIIVGQQRTNQGGLASESSRRVAARLAVGDLDGAAGAIAEGLRGEEAQRGSVRATLLQQAVKLYWVRLDAVTVAAAEEALIALDVPERPAWAPAFRARLDVYFDEGRDKGFNLSLEIAIALARRMLVSATTADERGAASNLLGNALAMLGSREAGMALLEAAVAAYRAALEERTRDRVPLDWAKSQHGLANGLAALAERRADRAALLAQAVDCMRDAVAGYRQVGAYWGLMAEAWLAELERAAAASDPIEGPGN